MTTPEDKGNGGDPGKELTSDLSAPSPDADPPETKQPDRSRRARAAHRAAEKLDGLALTASKVPGVIYVILGIAAVVAVAPWGGVPSSASPGGIIGSSFLLFWLAGVVALVLGGLALLGGYFLARSILARTLEQQWVFKAGGFETDQQSVQDVDEGLKELEEWQRRSERLEDKLSEMSHTLGAANATITILEQELDARSSGRGREEEIRVTRSNPPPEGMDG